MIHMGTGTSSSSTPYQQTPILPKNEITGSNSLKEQEQTVQISKAADNIICPAWAPKMQLKYLLIFNEWEKFCRKRGTDAVQSDELPVIHFLTEEYERGFFFS